MLHTTRRSLPDPSSGFTLIELMIVIVIVAVLAAIALPAYQNQIQRTNRTATQADMMAAAQAMEKYYGINFTYSGAAAGTTFPNEAPSDTPNKRYDISLSSISATTYTIRATPKAGSGQEGDGFMTLNYLGQRRWDKNDNNSTADADEDNWSPY